MSKSSNQHPIDELFKKHLLGHETSPPKELFSIISENISTSSGSNIPGQTSSGIKTLFYIFIVSTLLFTGSAEKIESTKKNPPPKSAAANKINKKQEVANTISYSPSRNIVKEHNENNLSTKKNIEVLKYSKNKNLNHTNISQKATYYTTVPLHTQKSCSLPISSTAKIKKTKKSITVVVDLRKKSNEESKQPEDQRKGISFKKIFKVIKTLKGEN